MSNLGTLLGIVLVVLVTAGIVVAWFNRRFDEANLVEYELWKRLEQLEFELERSRLGADAVTGVQWPETAYEDVKLRLQIAENQRFPEMRFFGPEFSVPGGNPFTLSDPLVGVQQDPCGPPQRPQVGPISGILGGWF